MKRQTKKQIEQFKLPFIPRVQAPRVMPVKFDTDAWVKELLARPVSKLEGGAQ